MSLHAERILELALSKGIPRTRGDDRIRAPRLLARQQRWRAFLAKSKLDAPALAEVIAQLRHLFALPD